MTKRTTQITLILASTLLTVGCTGLSHFREDIAIREMAKHSYASKSTPRGTGDHARHFERGWRQAYYNVSKGADTCPPSVPPEVYWSTKYQTPRGCQQIAAWYDGYRCGAAAAERECRPSYSTVPIMARCVRPDSQECNPVEALRSDVMGDYGYGQVGEVGQTEFTELAVDHAAEVGEESDSDAALHAESLSSESIHQEFRVSRFDDAGTPDLASASSAELSHVENELAGEVTPISYSQPTRLPIID